MSLGVGFCVSSFFFFFSPFKGRRDEVERIFNTKSFSREREEAISNRIRSLVRAGRTDVTAFPSNSGFRASLPTPPRAKLIASSRFARSKSHDRESSSRGTSVSTNIAPSIYPPPPRFRSPLWVRSIKRSEIAKFDSDLIRPNKEMMIRKKNCSRLLLSSPGSTSRTIARAFCARVLSRFHSIPQEETPATTCFASRYVTRFTREAVSRFDASGSRIENRGPRDRIGRSPVASLATPCYGYVPASGRVPPTRVVSLAAAAALALATAYIRRVRGWAGRVAAYLEYDSRRFSFQRRRAAAEASPPWKVRGMQFATEEKLLLVS